MTCINSRSFLAIATVLTLSVGSFGISNVFAEDEREYKMVGEVTPVLTFTFRDGIETHEFPVFEMGENLISNSGTTFSVEGTVSNSPLLHKALDDAYKYRLVSGNGHEFQSKYFDVDVDFVKSNDSVFMLDYNNCRVSNYQVETLDSNDYESYFKDVGFAVVDKIEFECSGVNFDTAEKVATTTTSYTDFGESGFNFANNVRSSATFSFDGGMEKIEFPSFDLVSGFDETGGTGSAEFKLEGIVNDYPLLYKAVDDSRKVDGSGFTFNTDFEVLVEFTNGQSPLRGLDFRDCRVSEAEISTVTDKEEGFTGKSGFAVVNQFGFTCSGLDPINMYLDELRNGEPIWTMSKIVNEYEEPIRNTDKNLRVETTFIYSDGIETIEFSMFSQDDVITSTEDDKQSSFPTFELRGILGDYPMLYKSVDNNREITGLSGTQLKDLVDVEVRIFNGDEVVRGFNYNHCWTTDYDIKTEADKEESYVKNKFAIVNVFDFECQGYHPYNPSLDLLMESLKESSTTSSKDLPSTDRWSPKFYMHN